ncbi:MAG: hypothetical protein ISS89_04650 [Candidatus Omnitrophica bacterium]|nr:hypothetical protein [Candidatus Omnitrophota bacterium]
MDRGIIKFENEILERLKGKLTLMQDKDVRDKVIFDLLLELYNAPEGKELTKHLKDVKAEQLFKDFLS